MFPSSGLRVPMVMISRLHDCDFQYTFICPTLDACLCFAPFSIYQVIFYSIKDSEGLGEENAEAVEMLLRMPGISWRNYQRVIARVGSIAELADCSLDRLTEILESRYYPTLIMVNFSAQSSATCVK